MVLMRKKQSPMFQIILNEQTPELPALNNPQEWIEKNHELLNSFLAYSRSKKKAVGLAANQISHYGKRLEDRFFAYRNGENCPWQMIIDPQIKSVKGDPYETPEKCLTWPGKSLIAERYPEILVSFWTSSGSFVENLLLEGYEAQIWQHEINHLNGKEEKFMETQEERRERVPGRNEPCPCGSGKKYKKCCGK